MDFIKWFKNTGLGWVMESQIPQEVRASFLEYLENTKKIGVYIFHSHHLENGEIKFKGMSIGYYVRGKNPFKWNFKSLYKSS